MTPVLLLQMSALFVVSLLVQRAFIALALRWRVLNEPNNRRRHARSTPSLGGLGVLVTWIVGLCLFRGPTAALLPWFIGAAAMSLLGLADDLFALRAAPKLIGQFAIATTVLYLDPVTHSAVTELAAGWLGQTAWIVAALWLVGLANAFNLIDGIDGLCAGTAVMSAVALAGFGILTYGPNHLPVIAMLFLLPALGGYLRFNWAPARVFLGDNGSLMLGFLLGFASLQIVPNKGSTLTPVMFACIFGYPILDMGLAVWRRLRKGQPIFQADRIHLHHRLLRVGLSVPQVCFGLYNLNGAFLLAAVSLLFGSIALGLVGLAAAVFGAVGVTYLLRCIERSRMRRLMGVALIKAGKLDIPVSVSSSTSRGQMVTIDIEPLIEAGLNEEKHRFDSLITSLELMLASGLKGNDRMEMSLQKICILLAAETENATRVESRFNERIHRFLELYNLQCSLQSLPVRVEKMGQVS